jgi:hypothetical protein
MRDIERRGDNMKKLITMLLATGLLTLLSLSTVAYADEGGNNGNGDNGKEDDKTVVLCQEKDDELKLIEVKKDDLEKYLEDGAFFPKAEVLEEDEDKATVKFWCDNSNGDNGNGKDDKTVIYPYQADKDDNGDKKNNSAAIGIRQSALVV